MIEAVNFLYSPFGLLLVIYRLMDSNEINYIEFYLKQNTLSKCQRKNDSDIIIFIMVINLKFQFSCFNNSVELKQCK